MDVDKLVWRKASKSTSTGGDCVELADLGAAMGVRDSKAPGAGHLTLDRSSLASLIKTVKAL